MNYITNLLRLIYLFPWWQPE